MDLRLLFKWKWGLEITDVYNEDAMCSDTLIFQYNFVNTSEWFEYKLYHRIETISKNSEYLKYKYI